MPLSRIIVYQNGKLVHNVKATLEYTVSSKSGFTTHAYTDSNGIATITHSSTGSATIYIDGRSKKSMNTLGQDSIYL